MRLFSKIYDRVMRWSTHPHAPVYLFGLSFSEASFFPVPPDVMLAPMSLSKPERAWWYATLTTLASTLGGIAGYLLGLFFWAMLQPWVFHLGYENAYHTVQAWFEHWGFWALFLAGFTPIPYKLFTLSAGAAHMVFIPFVMASLLGRGARFFLVASLMKMGGSKLEGHLRTYIDWIGWVTLLLLLVALYFYH